MISSKTTGRTTRWNLCAALAAAALAGFSAPDAQARSRHRASHGAHAAHAAPKAAATSAKPMLVGNYGDWGAYTAQGKSKVCYALAQPKVRSPASLKKDQAYIFISDRPSEGVHNEVSVIMGVPLKDGAAQAKAEIGSSTFDLVAKGQNAWMKNAADESRFLDVMKKGSKLIVKGMLVKGGAATDTYSLAGVGQALDRVIKECK